MSNQFLPRFKYIDTYFAYEGSAYEVSSNTDKDEGRGLRQIEGYFLSHSDAEDSIKKDPTGHVSEVSILIIVPSVNQEPEFARSRVLTRTFPLNLTDVETARKRALEKLTPEEKELLGITLTV